MDNSRRKFLSAAILGLGSKTDRPIAGSFVHEVHKVGHELRHRACLKKPSRTIRIPLVIVGAGIAGLSAAWRLDKRGFRDFVVLELAAQAGGNSIWGRNEITAYPWAAHYVPVPGTGSPLVRELFADLGVLKDGRWEERHLCHSPQERLFLHGRWQEGLEPEIGATRQDHEQYRRFEARIEELRASGQFTVPMEEGLRRAGRAPLLDRISMAEWMRRERFDSPYLNWYVNYACRDDYGALASDTSAWAGIHYFAAREAEEKGPLVWPEGNGWIVRRLLDRLGPRVRTNSMAYAIRDDGRRLRVATEDAEYVADTVIFAAPSYLAAHILENAPPVEGLEYSPWFTANLVLDRLPKGPEPAWDNVIFGSGSLGYVVATHQSLATRTERSVWTYYWALAEATAIENRRRLLEEDWNYWKELILTDLSRAHTDIRTCVSRIDIWRQGHAMARPVPGFLASEPRRRLAAGQGRVLFANSDLSGLSIFEEAQYRGVRAAERALRGLS